MMNINYDQELRLEILRILPQLGFNAEAMPARHRIPSTIAWADGLYNWVTNEQKEEVVEADPEEIQVEETPVDDTPVVDDCCGCGGCFEPVDDSTIATLAGKTSAYFTKAVKPAEVEDFKTWYVIAADVVLQRGSLNDVYLSLDRSGDVNSTVSLGGLMDVHGMVHGEGHAGKIYEYRTLRKLSDTRNVNVVFGYRSHGFVNDLNVRPASPAELYAAFGTERN
jgi:hypothetical protein